MMDRNIDSIAAQIYQQPYLRGLINPVMERRLQDLAAVAPKELSFAQSPLEQHYHILTMALAQDHLDYPVSKAACDALANFDFRDLTISNLLHDLRRTKFGSLEASLLFYSLGKKLHEQPRFDFVRDNFISNKFFIMKSLAFYYMMNDLLASAVEDVLALEE